MTVDQSCINRGEGRRNLRTDMSSRAMKLFKKSCLSSPEKGNYNYHIDSAL